VLFGRVEEQVVRLSELGTIVRESWLAVPTHFGGLQLHEFVVMPNHIHGIIQIVMEAGDLSRWGGGQLAIEDGVGVETGARTDGEIKDRNKTKTAQHAAPLQAQKRQDLSRLEAGSLSVIVRSFKAAVTRRARAEMNWRGGIWQNGYFDRVIRDGKEFADVTRYIAPNPTRWEVKD